MNINELCQELARREKGKKQINIAQIKELVGHFCEMLSEDPDLVIPVINHGFKRRGVDEVNIDVMVLKPEEPEEEEFDIKKDLLN